MASATAAVCNNNASQGKRTAIAPVLEALGLPLLSAEALTSEAPRPTDPEPISRSVAGGVGLVERRWGLKPAKAKGRAGHKLAEQGRTFTNGRCLVPATSFCEYTGDRTPKTRWRFSFADAEWFCIAVVSRAAEGANVLFTKLTIPPAPDVEPDHDRPLVILEQRDWTR